MGILDIFRIGQIKLENEQLKATNANLASQISSLGVTEYYQTKEKIALLERESNEVLSRTNREIASNNEIVSRLRGEIEELQGKHDKLSSSVTSQERKLGRIKELYRSVDYSISNFF